MRNVTKEYSHQRILKETVKELDALSKALSTSKLQLVKRLVHKYYVEIIVKQIENRELIKYLAGMETISIKGIIENEK